MDAAGCQMPNTCMPTKGPVGTDGTECAVTCPMECGKDMMNCPGFNNDNGCQMPDTCIPMPTGAAGECVTVCPTNCMAGNLLCPGVAGADGCPMPDTCVPVGTECPTNTF